ncbi:MAG: homoserine O-acetyltransferase [Spirochaetes bacterium]|nr:MAG: homoserine O-acetyltransferase [Spirochaetota bacterium]
MSTVKFSENSVGLVETRSYTFARPPRELRLVSGKTLGPVTLAYETYGELAPEGNNAILVLHALSGSAHAAGFHSPDDQYPGWWDYYIGPGKAFDTDKYFVISSNVIGGCTGSTGPASTNPATDREYGLEFPIVTIQDMVNAQWHLVRHLGIRKLLAVTGGSMGGMQALQWAISYPEMVQSVIALASSSSLSAQGIAFNEVGRQAIFRDPHFNGGDYYTGKRPDDGLSLARMIAHITYLSDKLMHEKFGRKLRNHELPAFNFNSEFMVESYLHHQGIKFVNRFDANSYLYISKAIDYFDLKADYNGSLVAAFESVASDFLIISYTSDWLYPSEQSVEIVKALRTNGKNVVYTEIETDFGHDTFLLDDERTQRNISNFLRSEFEKTRA